MKWKHLAVVAIQKSSTGSVTRPEIMDFISREFPSFPLTIEIQNGPIRLCPWFLNIGFKYMSVWTINPERKREIEEEMEAIVREIQKHRRSPAIQQPKTTFHLDPLHKLAHESVREMAAVHMSNGCTIVELKEIATRFSGVLLLNCPELLNSLGRKIKIVDMALNLRSHCISIDHSVMARHYKQILKVSRDNEEKIKASMENPQDFEALIKGHLKHGFDASPQDFGKLIEWTFTSREDNETWKENQRPRPGFPRPPFSTDQLIVLAYKNSCSGQLSAIQLYQFILKHFPAFSFRQLHVYRRLKVNLAGTMRMFCKINWTWEAMGEDVNTANDHFLCQILRSTWEKVQGTEEEQNAFDEDINWLEEPIASVGSYWDTIGKEVLIDDSWTMESEDVYFKHEITIESEDPPDDSVSDICFFGSEQSIKRRRVVDHED